MLKVVIVDDEALIRIGIKSCINWEDHGFQLVGEAKDGNEAVELIETTLPDIVITDVKMPNMDGLQLLAFLKKKHPQIKSVVLSCYNEMDYVKQAIKLGAEDYILKLSMDPEHLLDILHNLRKTIESEEGRQSDSKELAVKDDGLIIKNELYRQFLRGDIQTDFFRDKLSQLGYQIQPGHYILLYCEIDHALDVLSDSRFKDRHMLELSITNILHESLSMFSNGNFIKIELGKYFITLNFSRETDEQEFFSQAKQFCVKSNNAFKMYLNFTISFSVSNPVDSFNQFPQAYAELQNVFQHRFYTGYESIIFCCQVKNFCGNSLIFPLDQEKLLWRSLICLDGPVAEDIVLTFIDNIGRGNQYSPQQVRSVASTILSVLVRFSREQNVDYKKFNPDEAVSPFHIIAEVGTIQELKAKFQEWIRFLMQEAKDNQKDTGRHWIAVLKEYINLHVDEAITLDKAAGICNINKCYLSSIFKKETGQNFIDYVNEQKMKKAEELIKIKRLKTYEAASMVGISDESYFSKLFKKYIGINPSAMK